MSLQSSFVFHREAAADAFVPSHEVLMRYVAGEISADQAGLHNFYSCQRAHCPQCDARLGACYEFEGIE